MTPEQALQILDRVLANLQLNRQDHAVLQQALQTLYNLAVKKDDGPKTGE